MVRRIFVHPHLPPSTVTGIVLPSNLVATLLNTPPSTARSERHFSAFPLTSHLHTPVLRLISLHPFLTFTCNFLRVPEIHDGFQWKVFIARNTTVREVIDLVVEQLGLMKTLPIPGGGALDYVLEEVWTLDDAESKSSSFRPRRQSVTKGAQNQ